MNFRTRLLAILLFPAYLYAQEHTEVINKGIEFEKTTASNTLIVANINGSIHVKGYAGNSILIEVRKMIKAKSNDKLEKGKHDLSVGFIDRADTLIFYVEGLCTTFGKNDRNRNSTTGWGYNFDTCNRNGWTESEGYDYEFDFTIQVPRDVNVVLSTINKGDVDVTQVNGSVVAKNINGSIRLEQLQGETEATTINGNVDLNYIANPSKACRYYTLNGDINANFPGNLVADLSFKTFNGSFYTNIDKLELLPAQIVKSDSGSKTKYKINNGHYRIGNGGVNLDFETFNGNVYLKEKMN